MPGFLMAFSFPAFVGMFSLIAWLGASSARALFVIVIAACAYTALVVGSLRYRDSHGARSDAYASGRKMTPLKWVEALPLNVAALYMVVLVIVLLTNPDVLPVAMGAAGFTWFMFLILGMFVGWRSKRRNLRIAAALCNLVLVLFTIALELVRAHGYEIATLSFMHVFVLGALVQLIVSAAPLEDEVAGSVSAEPGP